MKQIHYNVWFVIEKANERKGKYEDLHDYDTKAGDFDTLKEAHEFVQANER